MKRNRVGFQTFIFAVGVAVALALFVAPAYARDGHYSFEGGNAPARGQVRAALEASSFDWGVVPVRVRIHIRSGVASHATPGDIWLDPRLLAAGRFGWGVVQHEYAHQVGFFLTGSYERARLMRVFGTRAWCHETRHHSHGANACERFAALLTWAHWRSPWNVAARPDARRGTSARRLVAAIADA